MRIFCPSAACAAKPRATAKEMVAARHALFCRAGLMPLFAEALAGLCAAAPAADKELHILDAGCGEGYYDAAVCAALTGAGRLFCLAGWDIAKPAVRLAAKQGLPCAEFAVASSFAAPVAGGWADLVLNVFSPFCAQ